MKLLNKATTTNILRHTFKHILIICSVFLLSTLLCAGLMVLTVMPTKLRLIYILLTDIKIMALNILPLFVIMMAIYYLSGRLLIGFLSTGALFFTIAEINRFKMFYRDDPFIYEDISLAKEAGQLLDSYRLFLDTESAIFLAVFVLVTVLLFFLSKYVRLKNLFGRALGLVITITVLVTSVNSLYFGNEKLYNELWHSEFGSLWKASDTYMSRGVVYSFIRSMSISSVAEPEGYDEEEAKAIYEKYETVPLPKDKKVHIISIMLEAFSDFSEFENIEFNKDPYLNFHQLQADGYSGKLYTNTFGANTIQTERSFLMGTSIPNVFQKNTLSYVRYFKDNGYYTEAMHPYFGWFYNRNNINTYIGFDNYLYYENFFKDIDYSTLTERPYYEFLSDVDFYKYIENGLEKAVANDQKYFNFSVTYQNHGPYPTYQSSPEEVLVRKDEYPEDMYNAANFYFHGVSRADLAIRNLRQFVDEQTEPVLLIFFGDHKPALDNAVYHMFKMNTSFDTAKGAENYFSTPYVFYANSAAKEVLERDFVEEGTTVSPMFLMNELFDYIGLSGSAYMNYMSDVKKEYDVINHVYCAKDGEYILTSEIEDSSLFDERQCIEYYMKNLPIK